MVGDTRYIVLAKRNDCGDFAVFQVQDARGWDFWKTEAEARAVMKADYGIMLAEYPFDWMTKAGKRRRKHRIRRSSAEFSVPIWDGERQRDSWLKCKWKIVKI